jgi:serine O-acetyltransferase
MFGANCRVHTGAVITTAEDYADSTPIIGDNVYIGPGVKIYGDITIADGIAIAPNTVVNRSFKEPNVTLGGVPALVIARRGSEGYLIKGAQRSV